MLQAHSWLWHYLWVAPNCLLLFLAYLLWRRELHKTFPFFFAFCLLAPLGQLITYLADLSPSVSPESWWRVLWVTQVVEGFLKLAVVGEIFDHAFSNYAALAKLGRLLIRALGAVLVLTAAVIAALTPNDSRFGIISGAHLLQESIYLIETGLLVFIFIFASHFKLRLTRSVVGIALGLATSACIHLASWAFMANGVLADESRQVLDLLNMAAYHVCVLMWWYYLLVPHTVPIIPGGPIPENNLAVWNRELERLLQS